MPPRSSSRCSGAGAWWLHRTAITPPGPNAGRPLSLIPLGHRRARHHRCPARGASDRSPRQSRSHHGIPCAGAAYLWLTHDPGVAAPLPAFADRSAGRCQPVGYLIVVTAGGKSPTRSASPPRLDELMLLALALAGPHTAGSPGGREHRHRRRCAPVGLVIWVGPLCRAPGQRPDADLTRASATVRSELPPPRT
jgi:hypothetical protein